MSEHIVVPNDIKLERIKHIVVYNRDIYFKNKEQRNYDMYRNYAAYYMKLVYTLGYKFADISKFPLEKYKTLRKIQQMKQS